MECYTSHVKMQLFKKGSSSSSPTEAIKIDNKGMTKEANHGKISNRSRNQHQPTHYTSKNNGEPNHFSLMGPQQPQTQPILGSKH